MKRLTMRRILSSSSTYMHAFAWCVASYRITVVLRLFNGGIAGCCGLTGNMCSGMKCEGGGYQHGGLQHASWFQRDAVANWVQITEAPLLRCNGQWHDVAMT